MTNTEPVAMTDTHPRRHGSPKAERRRHEPHAGRFRRECKALEGFAEPGQLPNHLLQRLGRSLHPSSATCGTVENPALSGKVPVSLLCDSG